MRAHPLDRPIVRAVTLLGLVAASNIVFYGALVGAGWAVGRLICALGGF